MSAQYVGPSESVPEGGRLVVTVANKEVGIFRVAGDLYAYENRCAHQGGPVCQGKLLPRVEEVLDDGRRSNGFRWSTADFHIVCPWHGYEYDIETGCHPGDARVRLRSFDVYEDETGGIYVNC